MAPGPWRQNDRPSVAAPPPNRNETGPYDGERGKSVQPHVSRVVLSAARCLISLTGPVVSAQVDDNKEPPKNDDDQGLMKNLLSSFDDPASGEGKTPIERAGAPIPRFARSTRSRFLTMGCRSSHPTYEHFLISPGNYFFDLVTVTLGAAVSIASILFASSALFSRAAFLVFCQRPLRC